MKELVNEVNIAGEGLKFLNEVSDTDDIKDQIEYEKETVRLQMENAVTPEQRIQIDKESAERVSSTKKVQLIVDGGVKTVKVIGIVWIVSKMIDHWNKK